MKVIKNIVPINVPKNVPPNIPSTVLLGEILGHNFIFPIFVPKKCAKVSVAKVTNSIYSK